MARDEDRGHVAVSDGSGFDFAGAFLDLAASIGSVHQAVREANAPVPWTACHPVWFTGSIPLTSGSGTLQQGDLYGPKEPYWWDLRTLSVWGMTGTSNSLTVYINSTSGEQILEADGSGQISWSSQILLSPQDQLVFSASSITGNVYFIGRAIEVETAWLPAYLM